VRVPTPRFGTPTTCPFARAFSIANQTFSRGDETLTVRSASNGPGQVVRTTHARKGRKAYLPATSCFVAMARVSFRTFLHSNLVSLTEGSELKASALVVHFAGDRTTIRSLGAASPRGWLAAQRRRVSSTTSAHAVETSAHTEPHRKEPYRGPHAKSGQKCTLRPRSQKEWSSIRAGLVSKLSVPHRIHSLHRARSAASRRSTTRASHSSRYLTTNSAFSLRPKPLLSCVWLWHSRHSSRRAERGWRATFYTTGSEHSPTSAAGTAWERTPWQATQRAAWAARRQAEDCGHERTVIQGRRPQARTTRPSPMSRHISSRSCCGRAVLKRPPGSELSLAGFGWPLVNFPVTLTRPSVS
jgi:hypothetical protein